MTRIHPDTASDRLANVRARLRTRATVQTAHEAASGRMAAYRCPRTGIVVLAIRPDGAVTTVSL